ncbi:2'-5' RNA ligase family protein [Streptacidiphilus cavernicola]|uniref:2'-5' RNA ligase family protein n=1 Tax=Streptacidiphilus cavernicola TaxID=3342716 RepID=A0ABV6VYP4_9ACTN
MKSFVFQRAASDWATETETLLHVYALIDLDRHRQLAGLLRGCREATQDFPLTFVEDRWLHITLDQIPDKAAVDIPEPEREQLRAELARRLGDFPAFEVTIGSVLSYHSGLIADISPDDQLDALHEAVHGAIRDLRGEAAAAYPWSAQHLTLAYANGEADSDEVQRRLRRVRPSHAPLRIDSVHIVDVAADAFAKTITWTDLAEIPLGRAA